MSTTKSPKTLIVIPSRMGATRLPNKPLADICGEPMVAHVWRRAVAADAGPVVVATDDQRIMDVITARGGQAVMTKPEHPSGSDRVYEAAEIFDPSGQYDCLLNVQGDLPLIDPQTIAAAARLMADPAVDIATAGAFFNNMEEKQNPNIVKIVGCALSADRLRAHYFSRAPIPHGDAQHIHHIGLYAFRRSALLRFVAAPPSPIELRERLEQLRALDLGMRIDVALVDGVPMSVDTPEDLTRVRAAAEALKSKGLL